MLSKLGGSSRARKNSVALGFLNNLVAVLEHQTSQQQELMTQDKKLNEVIDEILVTEATYLEDLSFTVDELQRPLKEMMDAHTHYTVFSNLEQLRELHIKLGADLSEAREDNCSTNRQGEVIAEAFLRLLPYFKMYAVYCGNAATAAVCACMKVLVVRCGCGAVICGKTASPPSGILAISRKEHQLTRR